MQHRQVYEYLSALRNILVLKQVRLHERHSVQRLIRGTMRRILLSSMKIEENFHRVGGSNFK